MKNWITIIVLNLFTIVAFAQSQEQIDAYVQSHKNLAIQEMIRTGIPASVTLAQGILETSAGTSPLYMRSNNNFGIKCKSSWTGKFTYHDDDAKGECFRVYDNDSASYADHSNFLKTSLRYNFLFQLDKQDYKSWAIGLRKAGYATNPAYASILIKHIEENNLQQYDVENNVDGISMMKHTKASSAMALNENKNTASPSTNLPSGEILASNDDKLNDFPTVHWQISNVSDATTAYTNTPVQGYSHPVYSSKTKSRYTNAKLHNISYGNAAKSKNGKTVSHQSAAKNSKTNSVASKHAVAKTSKKSTTHSSSAKLSSSRKTNQSYAKS